MMSGNPAGQHCPMSSRYTLPSACAFFIASKCTCAAGVSLFAGGGGPNRHEFGLPRSMNHVPVRSNGGLGRGFARLAGASGFNCTSGAGACGACAASGTAIAIATTAAITARFRIHPSPNRTNGSFVLHAHSDCALLVDVLAIVLADEFDHLVARHPTVCERVDDRLLQHHRILDRDLIVEH